MKVLYIGNFTLGTTSRQRGEQLKKCLEQKEKKIDFTVIDTHIPFFSSKRIWRSLGFRFKKGPLIHHINKYINRSLNHQDSIKYDLVWIDKGVFITPKTTQRIRSHTRLLLHFTPDMAFFANYSRLFIKSIKHYDYVVTTKSAETEHYQAIIPKEKIISITQGYDLNLHRPVHDFEEKEHVLCFVGLYEPSRETAIQKLLNHQIHVKIAGKGWENFAIKNQNISYFSFYGDSLFGDEYVRFISSSIMGLGFLSKLFPERHTTRTFEIPACGTALITERNEETIKFFAENEAIFYDSDEEMIEKIKYYMAHPAELEKLTQLGNKRVINDGRDYGTIIKHILKKVEL